MSDRWRIRFEVWPGSTGNGAEADQEAVGERHRVKIIDRANTLAEALQLFNLYADGMRDQDSRIWQVRVNGGERI